jgi:hypothetical protein
MALIRPKFPKHRDCLVINDVPVRAELSPRTREDTYGDKFSAISNMNMLKAFRKGTLDAYSEVSPDTSTISHRDINTTYLDYTYYGEPEVEKNFDYVKEIRKRNGLDHELRDKETGIQFYKLEHQKDVYVSERLWGQVQELLDEIKTIEPKLIIVTGKWSLFFLTGCTGLGTNLPTGTDRKPFGGLAKFRSSILQINATWDIFHEHILIPIYHPVNAISMPNRYYEMDMDIQKICYMYNVIKESGVGYYIKPAKEYIIADTIEKIDEYFDKLIDILDKGETLVSIDIETFYRTTIDCVGFAYEIDRGCCVPFMSKDNPVLWSKEEEIYVLEKLYKVMLHPNCKHLGQNYQFDLQHFYKLWNLYIEVSHDTMVLHHLLFNKLPKDLAYLASLYCEFYTYWKGDIEATTESPETRWEYNAKDCCYTLEVFQVIYEMLKDSGEPKLEELYKFQIEELHPELVHTMNFGVAINREMKDELYIFFKNIVDKIPERINNLLGFEFNPASSQQKKKLFKEYFGITLKTNKKKGVGHVETCDAKAMLAYIEEYPDLKPFLAVLLEYSALSKFTSTFLGAKVDADGKMRTQYRISGTSTGRLASTKNVWGGGLNMQNLPEKGKVPIYYLLQLLDDIFAIEGNVEDSMDFVNQIEDIEYEPEF